MSILPELLKVVESSSPAIATALGGPLAGIAMTLVANLFGIKSTDQTSILNAIQTDPDAALKLKTLEYSHAEELKKISSIDFSTSITDKMDARRNSSQYANFLKYMAAMVTIGFFCTLYLCFISTSTVNEPEKQILLVFVGVLTSKWQTIIDFFYGSSNK